MKTLHVHCAHRIAGSDDTRDSWTDEKVIDKNIAHVVHEQYDETSIDISHQALWLWTILRESCD